MPDRDPLERADEELARAQERQRAEAWLCERLAAWLAEDHRRPAGTAFTAGPLRELARRIEDMLADRPLVPRIVSDPRILGGTPVVEGTRVPAETVLAEVAAGTAPAEIHRSYPSLPPRAVEACVRWANTGRPL